MKVIYLTGAGRSGSTVMDIVLGSHPDIVSVGELINLVSLGWTKGEYCACGQRGNKCPFWSDVRKEWSKLTGGDDLGGYLRLQNMFERYRRLPGLVKGMRRRSPDFRLYAEQTHALYKAIGAVSNKSIIVDSSKNSCRALALSAVPEIDLRLVHLVRDGRGVVWSCLKAYGKDERGGVPRAIHSRPAWRTTLFWLIANYHASSVLQRVGPAGIRVRYEDFVEDPGRVLKAIGGVVGADLTQVSERLLSGEVIPVGHTTAGNRVRMSGAVRLRPDYGWKELLPDFDKKLFWLLAGPLAKKFGYRRCE